MSVVVTPRHADVEQTDEHASASREERTVPLPPATPNVTVRRPLGAGANVAVTFCAPFMVTRQSSSVPVHPPDQPVNTVPGFGVATNCTCAPSG